MSASQHLRAMARAILADATERAATLGAIADEIDRAADAWIPIDDGAALANVSPRVLREAASRGEIVLGGSGRRRVVRRADLDTWIKARASKLIAAPIAANDSDEDRAAFARSAARAGR
jgi:hypothetical protein